MADILKVSPTAQKQTNQISRNAPDPSVPFEIKDVSKVNNLATPKQNEQQNQTITSQKHSEMLSRMLQDPDGSIQLIKSLHYILQAVSMLPIVNGTINKEEQGLFHQLLMSKEDLLEELVAQSKGNTSFHGMLFESISQLLFEHPSLKKDIAMLLKSLCYRTDGKAIRHLLAEKLQELRNKCPQSYNPTIDSILSLLKNHASREEVSRSLMQFFQMVNQQPTTQLKTEEHLINQLLLRWFESEQPIDISGDLLNIIGSQKFSFSKMLTDFAIEKRSDQLQSKVFNTILSILQQVDSYQLPVETTEQILRTILASPSYFLPLHHFILPFQMNDVISYAECWIDNFSQQDSKDNNHFKLLLVIAVESLGNFELEITGKERSLEVNLYTPKGLEEQFQSIVNSFYVIARKSDYRISSVSVEPLRATRSLMDVFPHLSLRQQGLDLYV